MKVSGIETRNVTVNITAEECIRALGELLGNLITKLLVSTNQVSFFYTG